MIMSVFTISLVTADTNISWIDYITENWVVITVCVTAFILFCCCCCGGACCYACVQNDCSCSEPGKFCIDCLVCPYLCMIYFSETPEQRELRKIKRLLKTQQTVQMMQMYELQQQRQGIQQQQQQQRQQQQQKQKQQKRV